MMRGQVLTIKQADYIMAGKLQGNKNFRLMFKHILPNSISPIIVMMTQQVGQTILAEAEQRCQALKQNARTRLDQAAKRIVEGVVKG